VVVAYVSAPFGPTKPSPRSYDQTATTVASAIGSLVAASRR
jgi:hypothetical protein